MYKQKVGKSLVRKLGLTVSCRTKSVSVVLSLCPSSYRTVSGPGDSTLSWPMEVLQPKGQSLWYWSSLPWQDPLLYLQWPFPLLQEERLWSHPRLFAVHVSLEGHTHALGSKQRYRGFSGNLSDCIFSGFSGTIIVWSFLFWLLCKINILLVFKMKTNIYIVALFVINRSKFGGLPLKHIMTSVWVTSHISSPPNEHMSNRNLLSVVRSMPRPHISQAGALPLYYTLVSYSFLWKRSQFLLAL